MYAHTQIHIAWSSGFDFGTILSLSLSQCVFLLIACSPAAANASTIVNSLMSSFYCRPCIVMSSIQSMLFAASLLCFFSAVSVCASECRPHSIFFHRVASLMQYIRSNCYLNSCYYITWFHVNNVQLMTDHFSLSFDQNKERESAGGNKTWLSIDVSQLPRRCVQSSFCLVLVCLVFVVIFFIFHVDFSWVDEKTSF